jgi:signal transduction histidine kinase/CHASE3 domain sensor protein
MPEQRRRYRVARRFAVFGPAAIVLVTGLLAYAALSDAVDTRRLVLHSRDVLDGSSSLTTALLDAETGQLALLATHDSAFLEPYSGAADRVQASLARLHALTSDNPQQRQRLDSLAGRVQLRLALIDSSLALEARGDFAAALRTLQTGARRGVRSDIRRLVDSLEADEDRLLVARQAAERRSTQLTSAIIVAGTLLAGLLAFLVNRNFDRALRDRRLALAESRLANERLTENAIELEHQADMAQQAALAAEQANEQAQAARRAAEESERRAERLQEATEALTSAQSTEQVANLIVTQAIGALAAHSGAVAAIEADGARLRFVAAHGIAAAEPGTELDIDTAYPICAAAREGKPVVLETPELIAQRFPAVVEVHARDNTKAVVAYPLLARGRTTGALLIRFDAPHALSVNDRAFLAAMSRIASEALDRARLFEAERTARAQAETANRAKAAFLASMSHELRTPLQAALGFSQLVRAGVYGDINAHQAEVLGRVERSQTHLARLIDDILDFARLEAGRVRLAPEAVRVADIINDLAPLVEPQASAKDIELALLPPSDSLRVFADAHRLRQILVNIVGNAIKFTPEAGSIRVGAMRVGSSVVISVRDDGMGIPADRLQSIFEPFVQVDDRLTRTASGAGLGLAISRDLARAMGGDITVESELRRGSTFSVRLPLYVDEHVVHSDEGGVTPSERA